MECRQCTPSVIAKLMGLNTLPPPHPIHHQQRVLSENYKQRTSSIGLRQKRLSSQGRFFRMKVDELQDFKDVFEVPKNSLTDQHHSLSARNVKESSTEVEMGFYDGLKVLDQRYLSPCEKSHNSMEFYDGLKVLDSKIDSFLGCIQQPSSMFSKHLEDQQDIPSHHQRISVLKASSSPNSRENEKSFISRRTTKQRNLVELHQELNSHLLTHSSGVIGAGHSDSDKLLKLHLKPTNKKCISSRKIVLLKPIRGEPQKASNFFSTNCSEVSHTSSGKYTDFQNPKNSKVTDLGETTNNVNNLEPFRHSPRVSMEFSKRTIRQMRHIKADDSAIAFSSEMTGDDISTKESKAILPLMPNLFDRKNWYQTLYSHSNDSTSAHKAMLHPSEHWRTTMNYQEDGLAFTNRAVGEMHVMPHAERSSKIYNYRLGKRPALGKRLSLNGGDSNTGVSWGSISDRDGRMDGHFRNNLRSKSLPPSTSRSPKPLTSLEALHSNRYLMAMEAVKQGQIKLRMQKSNHIDISVPMESRSNTEKIKSNSENDCTVWESNVIGEEMREELREENMCRQDIVVLKTFVVPCLDSDNSSIIHKSRMIQDNAFDAFIQQEVSITFHEEDYVLLGSPCHPSPRSSEEASQSSPVSVLESLSKEALSSDIEYSESVSTDLQELRAQLQKLNPESVEDYSEGPGMTVSSDEDIDGESIVLVQENGESTRIGNDEKSMDFSYLVDVLDEAGFNCGVSKIIYEVWYSQEEPIDSEVFEILEKKYGPHKLSERSERKLLFDRINNGLMEVLQPCIGLYNKPSSVKKRIISWWRREVIEEELWVLLVSQEKEAGKESAKMPLGREMRWLDLVEGVDSIGKELEKFLIDELVAEFVHAESF